MCVFWGLGVECQWPLGYHAPAHVHQGIAWCISIIPQTPEYPPHTRRTPSPHAPAPAHAPARGTRLTCSARRTGSRTLCGPALAAAARPQAAVARSVIAIPPAPLPAPAAAAAPLAPLSRCGSTSHAAASACGCGWRAAPSAHSALASCWSEQAGARAARREPSASSSERARSAEEEGLEA